MSWGNRGVWNLSMYNYIDPGVGVNLRDRSDQEYLEECLRMVMNILIQVLFVSYGLKMEIF